MSVDTTTAESAVTLEEAKAHLRVDSYDEDSLITSLCLAVTQMCEHELQRPIVSREGDEGFGDVEHVPAAIKQWILHEVGHLYEQRQSTVTGSMSRMPWIDALLDPFRRYGDEAP